MCWPKLNGDIIPRRHLCGRLRWSRTVMLVTPHVLSPLLIYTRPVFTNMSILHRQCVRVDCPNYRKRCKCRGRRQGNPLSTQLASDFASSGTVRWLFSTCARTIFGYTRIPVDLLCPCLSSKPDFLSSYNGTSAAKSFTMHMLRRNISWRRSLKHTIQLILTSSRSATHVYYFHRISLQYAH